MTKDLFQEGRSGCHLQNAFTVKSLESGGQTEAAAKSQKPGSLLDSPPPYPVTSTHTPASREWPSCTDPVSLVAPGVTMLVDGFPKRQT